MHNAFDVSIIIVTWNSQAEIGNCLRSIYNSAGDLKIEIIIVDNNSADKTIDVIKELPQKFEAGIRLIKNEDNLGFTKACNQGIDISTGKNILFLNPDTRLEKDALDKLNKKLNTLETTAGIAPQLLNDDGSIQYSCRTFPDYIDMFSELSLLSSLFPQIRTFSKWKMNYFDHDHEMRVDQPMAAALMVKKKVVENIDGFDERYKMFFNDVDLCKKIYDIGFDIIFYPEAKVFHTKGVSIYKDRERMIRVWTDDCLSYFRKNNYDFLLYSFLWISLKLSVVFRILLYKLKK